jgi:hypothetical protein
MKINILKSAKQDLLVGYSFYEMQNAGLGDYFLDSIYSDIESLKLYAGIHPLIFDKYYQLLTKDFHLQSIIALPTGKKSFVPYWTFEKILLGLERDLYKEQPFLTAQIRE